MKTSQLLVAERQEAVTQLQQPHKMAKEMRNIVVLKIIVTIVIIIVYT